MFGFTPREKAYIGPFLAFLGALLLGEFVGKLWEGHAFWAFSAGRYWIYPLQTLVCGFLLVRGWKYYELALPRKNLITAGIGVLVLCVWIAPQEVFGFAPRTDGFEPEFFGGEGPAYLANVGFRFIRLVIIVPLVEEIFWRGFLLRYVIRQDFENVPFGTFEWRSFAVVTIGFCLEHSFSDWPAALLAGALYNGVAYWTRSLSACVVAHAITNLLLGIYVMRTGQWGFW